LLYTHNNEPFSRLHKTNDKATCALQVEHSHTPFAELLFIFWQV